jgi:hypothetical protein
MKILEHLGDFDMKRHNALLWIFGVSIAALIAGVAAACPFCSAVSRTFSQEIQGADVAVIAELVQLPPSQSGSDGGFAPGLSEPLVKSKFRVLEPIKGADALKNIKQVEANYFGDSPVGSQFLITGMGPQSIAWSTPVPLSKEGRQYILDVMKLPDTGPERLVFFQKHLEDDDQVLARDAHDEFALAPYADLRALAPRMDHDQLISWLKSTKGLPSHRRLYYTMLGVCGTEKDLPMLESLLESKDRKLAEGLDVLIGSYLAIKGPEGISKVEDLFLKNKDAEFVDTNSAIRAVRISEDSGIITKDKAAAALRYVLDNPKLADLVIPDLARWQDWTVMNRLVELFKQSDPQDSFVRLPVLRYLQVCPLPEAKVQLAQLEKLDPDAAKRATAFPLFGGAMGAKAPAEKGPASK